MDEQAATFLELEARALLTRLDRVKPFALHEVMVPAANISPAAQAAVDRYLAQGRRRLRVLVTRFIDSLNGAAASRASPAEMQRQFTVLRLRFDTELRKFDMFNDALSQRSEREIGVWLAGLERVAEDALALRGHIESVPPVVCYLDAGLGAAIRRPHTPLPGGSLNPVALIRIPRERLVTKASGSLAHECGHAIDAQLKLVGSFRRMLQARQQNGGAAARSVWQHWKGWLSEIVPDSIPVSLLGVASVLGAINVFSLPRAFVFQVSPDDRHPPPATRVTLLCALGKALYPSAQWDGLSRLWQSLYPTNGLPEATRALFQRLEASIPDFVSALLEHRPRGLGGEPFGTVLRAPERQPAQLSAYYKQWRSTPAQMFRAPPTLALAVIGQARAQHKITPEQESDLVARLLTHWALRGTQTHPARRAAVESVRTTTHAARPNFLKGQHDARQRTDWWR